MNVKDYLKYSAKIEKGDKFFIINIDGKGWEGALSQGIDLEEAHMMAKAVIYDYIEGLVEFKKRIPEPQVINDGSRYIIDVGYDTALKIMLRNTMYDLMVKPAELARRIGVTRQQLNNILSFRKSTNLNSLALCFDALGKPLTISV
ncbi:MAG: type II toxin-antitoxin system HicB family antitoxin [Ruminobacter sp.]|nr:type II toxin-antitoxin system HicB family antitoxin [Ruminobacter sp.]